LTDEQQEVAVSFLGEVPLLSSFSAEEQRQLASMVRLSEYDEGSLIIEQGARGESCHFLFSGHAQAEKDGHVVWTGYSVGDFFGELALLEEDRPRAASIRAVGAEGTACFTLGREAFQRVAGRSSEMLQERQQAYDNDGAATSPAAAANVPPLPTSAQVAATLPPPRASSSMLSAHRTPIARKPKGALATPARPPIAAAATVTTETDIAAAVAEGATKAGAEEPRQQQHRQHSPTAGAAAAVAADEASVVAAEEENARITAALRAEAALAATGGGGGSVEQQQPPSHTSAGAHSPAAAPPAQQFPPEMLELLAQQLAAEGSPQLETRSTPEPEPEPEPKPEPQTQGKGKGSRKKKKGSGKSPPPLPQHVLSAGGDSERKQKPVEVEAEVEVRPRSTSRDWGKQLQGDAAELASLAKRVDERGAEMDRQVRHVVAPELARYQELLELIMAGRGTDADNIEMERLGAALNLESSTG
jgi:hypothetical protein